MKIVPPDAETVNRQIAEARQLSVAAPIIEPMLNRKKLAALQRLLGAHRDGKPVDTNAVAEIYIIEQLQNEMRSKLEALNFTPKE